MKKTDKKLAAPENLTRKEDLNRVRGTVEFIDPEKGPTHKGKMTGNRGNKK
jgi:hypothetical protein